MQIFLCKTQTVSWPTYYANRKKGILPINLPLLVFKTEVHSLLTHKAYRWTQCNSLHHFSQWKSHMCAFPSVSWPAWTWLAGCLEKFMTLIKQCGLSGRRVLWWLPHPGWQSGLQPALKSTMPGSQHHTWVTAQNPHSFYRQRVRPTSSTNMCRQTLGMRVHSSYHCRDTAFQSKFQTV